MKLTIDTDTQLVVREDDGVVESAPLYSARAFELLSDEWVRVGWNLRYSYQFTWMGIPMIQLPEDVMRVQEVVSNLKPDVIVETGVAHGGSLIFYASLFEAMGKGKVIGVDIEIRPHNRKAIEAHWLSKRITLIEGDSASPEILAQVRAAIPAGARVLVILDSDHSRDHVLKELEAYQDLVSVGSYIVATDGIMGALANTPGGKPEWDKDNPTEAAKEFAATHSHFVLDPPAPVFSEAKVHKDITYWPGAWLKRTA